VTKLYLALPFAESETEQNGGNTFPDSHLLVLLADSVLVINGLMVQIIRQIVTCCTSDGASVISESIQLLLSGTRCRIAVDLQNISALLNVVWNWTVWYCLC